MAPIFSCSDWWRGLPARPLPTYLPVRPPLFLFHHGSSLRAIVLYLPLIVSGGETPARGRGGSGGAHPGPPARCRALVRPSLSCPSLSPFPHLTPASARWPPLQFFDYTPFLRFSTMFLSPCCARGPATVRPICPQRPASRPCGAAACTTSPAHPHPTPPGERARRRWLGHAQGAALARRLGH